MGTDNLGAAARSGGQAGTLTVVLWLAAAAAVIGAVCASIYLLRRTLHRHRYHNHQSLFAGLCQVHGLRRRTRALLRELARLNRLPHPARLFVEPRWLDGRRVPAALQGRAAELAELRNRLFPEPDQGQSALDGQPAADA